MSDRYGSRRERPHHERRDSGRDAPPFEGRGDRDRPPRRYPERGRGRGAPGGRDGLGGRGESGGANRSLLDILSGAAPSAYSEPGLNNQPLQFSGDKGPQQDTGPSSASGEQFPTDRHQGMSNPPFPSQQTMGESMYPGGQGIKDYRGNMPQRMGGDGAMGSMMGGMGMMNDNSRMGGSGGMMGGTGMINDGSGGMGSGGISSGGMGGGGMSSGGMGSGGMGSGGMGGGGMAGPGGMMDSMGAAGGLMGNMMAGNGGMMDQPMGYSSALQESFWGTGYMVYPGDPNLYVPMPGKRPVGCKTVKFTDIPFNVTEDMIREICDKVAGTVESCEKDRGLFCTVRFRDSASVDKIFSVHGMQICVGNNKTSSYAGRLLIDYVRNYSDLRDYDGEQRRIARELRHQQAQAEAAQEVIHFTSPYIEQVTERIKEDTVAGGSINILVTWMERGHCTKKTSRTFYQLIQLTNNHMKRLQVEKIQVEQVLEQARMKYIAAKGSIVMQLTLIEQVFTSATKKKVWDHFTKGQRKNLDQWRQAVKLMKSSLETEVHPEEGGGEADMDIDSDEEEERRRQMQQWKRRAPAKPRQHPSVVETIDLSEEDTTKQEPQDMVSSPPETPGTASQAPLPSGTSVTGQVPLSMGAPSQAPLPFDNSVTGQAPLPVDPFGNMVPPPPPPPPEEQPQLPPPEKRSKLEEQLEQGPNANEQRRAIEELQRENEELKAKLEYRREEPTLREKETQIKALQLAFVNMQQQLREAKAKLKTEEERRSREKADGSKGTAGTGSPADPSVDIVREMRDGALMSFMSIFLHAHPFGASIDYLYSYLQRLQPGVTQSDIEQVLQRNPNCFTEELSGVGASIERRWKFIAFENVLNID